MRGINRHNHLYESTMLMRRLMCYVRHSNSTRYFSNNLALRCSKTPKENTGETSQSSTDGTPKYSFGQIHLTQFQKRMLVWVKRYPSMEACPNVVSREILLQGQSKARIKAANYMILFSVIGFIWAIITGKRQHAEGISITKKGIEYYESVTNKKVPELDKSPSET